MAGNSLVGLISSLGPGSLDVGVEPADGSHGSTCWPSCGASGDAFAVSRATGYPPSKFPSMVTPCPFWGSAGRPIPFEGVVLVRVLVAVCVYSVYYRPHQSSHGQLIRCSIPGGFQLSPPLILQSSSAHRCRHHRA